MKKIDVLFNFWFDVVCAFPLVLFNVPGIVHRRSPHNTWGKGSQNQVEGESKGRSFISFGFAFVCQRICDSDTLLGPKPGSLPPEKK